MSAPERADVLVIGAGIAGASLAYALSEAATVIVVERESQPGVHSTGRSAALFMESYGPPQVRALTRASRAFLEHPPMGFCERPILSPRGAMLVASESQLGDLDEHWGVLRTISAAARRLDRQAACELVPVLRPERVAAAVHEPDAADIDVDVLHQGYLRGLRRHGGRVHCNAEVRSLERRDGVWRVAAGDGEFEAPIVVNAAGAWCDEIARLAGAAPIGLVPKRRSAFVFDPPADRASGGWPLFGAIDETWYVKPDAGQLLGSPANADPVAAHDVQPEALDIAIAIDRIQAMTALTIARPRRTWAGLRSFVADGELVGGFDAHCEGFFWLAGQGGYGIQTSAAMGAACAAIVEGRPVPARLAGFGIDAAGLSPARSSLVVTARP